MLAPMAQQSALALATRLLRSYILDPGVWMETEAISRPLP